MSNTAEARRHPRFKLPAMYTYLQARAEGSNEYQWDGYVYDISESGIRFELDEVIEPGTNLQVHICLPGKNKTEFGVLGHIVRNHDEDGDAGPSRMAMTFDKFEGESDRRSLENYLIHNGRAA